MVSIDKQINKHKKKKKIRHIKLNLIRYIVEFPIYYIIIKPYEYLEEHYVNLRDNYYRKRFDLVERKAFEEMKIHASKELSRSSEFAISEEGTIDDTESMCIKKFLKYHTLKHKRDKGKFSKIYGRLFQDKVKENHLKYMNDLVIWLLDEGCNIEYVELFGEGYKNDLLLATMHESR